MGTVGFQLQMNILARETLQEFQSHPILRTLSHKNSAVLQRLWGEGPVSCDWADAEGRLQYHYMIVEVAATPVNPDAEITALDDAMDVM
eukprot:1179554-Prorocentrum_minimum.AAC.3